MNSFLILPLKILQTISSPSVFILVFFILGIIFVFQIRRRGLGKILLIIGITIYYIFSITPIADLILLPLENQYASLEKIDSVDRAHNELYASVDTIVLLTGGMKRGDLPLTSILAESALFRTIETIRVYFKTDKQVKIIISGTNEETVSIAEFLESFNIPKEDIILEGESRNTYDSAKAVKKIVDEEPFFLVTSAYHMPRSVYIFKKLGTNPIPIPCDYRVDFWIKGTISTRQPFLLDFFPRAENLKKVNLAFHEYFGLLYYRFLK